jgi:hypothetical protein
VAAAAVAAAVAEEEGAMTATDGKPHLRLIISQKALGIPFARCFFYSMRYTRRQADKWTRK